MDLIIKLLLSTLEGMFWSIIFLFVAFFILPPAIIDKLLKRLRPDLVSKNQLLNKFKLVLDYILNNKKVIIALENEEDNKIKQSEFQKLIEQKKQLEHNLFFLDMLKNLTSMLSFSVHRTGYSENDTLEIIQQSMEYLMHYGNQLKQTPGNKNQRELVYTTAMNLNEQLSDIFNMQSNPKDDKKTEEMIKKITLKTSIETFNSTMENEYSSTQNQLNQINQLLGEKFINFLEK